MNFSIKCWAVKDKYYRRSEYYCLIEFYEKNNFDLDGKSEIKMSFMHCTPMIGCPMLLSCSKVDLAYNKVVYCMMR